MAHDRVLCVYSTSSQVVLPLVILVLQQEQQSQYEKSPESNNWKTLFKNPQVAKEFSGLFSSLKGYPLAQQSILNEVGLPSDPGNIENTPVSEITSKSEASDIAGTDPSKISNNPEKVTLGYEYAIRDELKKEAK